MPILIPAALAAATSAATLAAATTPAAPPIVARMVSLYDDACLKTFPDDAALDAAMARRKATPLTAEQVKVTLGSDPGRGWIVRDGGPPILVVLELPPYHACSVRALAGDGPHDLAPYRAAVDAYKATRPGFAPEPAMDVERGGIHMHAESDRRVLSDGTNEALMVIEQKVVDPAQMAPGTTAAPLRFVHQIRIMKPETP